MAVFGNYVWGAGTDFEIFGDSPVISQLAAIMLKLHCIYTKWLCIYGIS